MITSQSLQYQGKLQTEKYIEKTLDDMSQSLQYQGKLQTEILWPVVTKFSVSIPSVSGKTADVPHSA